MTTIYKVYWDNGAHACGTFPEEYATEAEAQAAADAIDAENRAQGVWDDDGGCEVIAVEKPDDEEEGPFDPVRAGWVGRDGRP